MKITYLIAVSATLIPAWIGEGILTSMDTEESIFMSSNGLWALIFLAFAFWGTSFAYFYLGKIKYAILSGLGKWLLVYIGIWIYSNALEPSERGHPYIIFLGLAAAMIWGIMDFGLLHPTVKKINLAANSKD